LLGYISRTNRHALLALHQLGLAPDFQVAEIPSLQLFRHKFHKRQFHVSGSLTRSQASVLEKAAQKSLDAFLDQALQLAKILTVSLSDAAEGLVRAVQEIESAAVTTQASRMDRKSESVTGCCYYLSKPPEENMPYQLCADDPQYAGWDRDHPCITSKANKLRI
jgi:hypothetical protein